MSERQLDEEFGKLKFLNIDNLSQLNQAINSFGSIVTLTNKYATQRPPTSELNDLSPTIEQKPHQQSSNTINYKNQNNNNSTPTSNNDVKINGNHSNNTKLANGTSDKNNNNKSQNYGQNGANGGPVNNTPKINGNNHQNSNNNSKPIVDNKINGVYFNDYIDDEHIDEGEFIEVKKPRKFL